MMKKFLYKYKNGNAITTIFDDGTKITETPDDEFDFKFPENFDFKITNCCPYQCEFCHENSIPKGKHAKLKELKFLESLHAGTECAIGGGSVTSHPDLLWLLQFFKEHNVIANITINQRELESKEEFIQNLIDEKLVYGIGISFTKPSEILAEFIKKNKNCVIHLIAGIHTKEDLDWLSTQNAKILILGYKDLRRGADLKKNNSEAIEKKINFMKENIIKEYYRFFKTISFDNLALEQLNVKSQVPEETWEAYYQGEDGTRTMYIDGVNEEYAISSTSKIRYPIKKDDTINSMFNVIKEAKCQN